MRRRGRSTYIDLSVLALDARCLSRAPDRLQLNCDTLARGSSRFNSMNRSTAHKTLKRFMFLSVLLYRKVLDSDHNLLAPMCAGSLLTVGSGVSACADGRTDGGGGDDVFLLENTTFAPFSVLPTCTSTHFRPPDVTGYGQPYSFLSVTIQTSNL